MKNLFVWIVALIGSIPGGGQSLAPYVVAPGGGRADAGALTLEWTLGELAVRTVPLSEGLLTEGVLQPHLQVRMLSNQTGLSPLAAAYQVKVYPNPVRSLLHLRVESDRNEPVNVQLFDPAGRERAWFREVTPWEDLTIDLAGYPPAMYHVVVRNETGEVIRQFRVVKIN